MANIYIINRIKLDRYGLRAYDALKKWFPMRFQQGTHDGACVAYSTMMALLCAGAIDGTDTDFWKKVPDKRTTLGKFLSHIFEEQGMLLRGYSLKTMACELRSNFDNLVIHYKTKANDVVQLSDFIQRKGVPVILRLRDQLALDNNICGLDHAVLAIGVEYASYEMDGTAVKILCLDPGNKTPKTTYWNCFIDAGRRNSGDCPFWYVTNEGSLRVEVTEFIAIEPINMDV